MNDNICILPFNSISIHSSGDLRVCCNSQKSFHLNVKNFDNEYEILNNKKIIEIRKDFLQDMKTPTCDRCWKLESLGASSFRHDNNTYFDINNTNIEFNAEINFDNIQYLDITLSNKCNLACRMCHPFSSSLVSKQWATLGKEVIKGNLIEFDNDSETKIMNIIEMSKNLSLIYMLGGEPLISDFHDKIINFLVDSGRSKNITLHYSTNLQIDIEKYLKIWSHFKLVNISVSIDGTDDTYEYIRWPGKWKKLENNLYRLKDYNLCSTNLACNIATTVQNLNVDNLVEIINKINHLSNNLFTFYFIPVTDRNYIEMIPESILIKTLNDLNKFDEQIVFKIGDLKKIILNAIEKNKKVLEKDVIDFFRWQKDYDNLRNQNLFKIKSHFIPYAEEYNIPIW